MIIWQVLEYSLMVSTVAVMIFVLKKIFHDKLDARWHYFVWAVLAVRMAVAVSPDWLKTPVSLFQSVPVGFGIRLLEELVRKKGLNAAAGLAGRIYLAGAAALTVFYLAAGIAVRIKALRSSKASRQVIRSVEQIAMSYGLKSCKRIRIAQTSTPYICGLIRPVLVLTPRLAHSLEHEAVLSGDGNEDSDAGSSRNYNGDSHEDSSRKYNGESRKDQEAIIVHELLHKKYKDVLVNYLLRLARAVNWFNPLIWYITAVIQNDSEALCDQRVLELMEHKKAGAKDGEGTYAKEYGGLLISMAQTKGVHSAKTGTSNMSNSYRSMRLRIKRIVEFGRVPSGIGIAALGITFILSISGIGYYEESGKIFRSYEIGSERQLSKAILYAQVFDAGTPEEAIYLYLRAMRYGNPLYLMAVTPESEQAEYEEWIRQAWRAGELVTGKKSSIYNGEGWIDYPLEEPNPWFYEDGDSMNGFRIHNLMLDREGEGTATVQVWLPYSEEYLLWKLVLKQEKGWKVSLLSQEKTEAENFYFQEPLFTESRAGENWMVTLEGRNEADFLSHFSENSGLFSFMEQTAAVEEYPQSFDMSYKYCSAYVTYLGEEPLDGHKIRVVIETRGENAYGGNIDIDGEKLEQGSRFCVFESGVGYDCWKAGDVLPEFTAWIYVDEECVEIIGGSEA